VTLTPTQVDRLLVAHGIDPRRGLGQNFVADPNTVRRIARLAGVGAGDRVVEIGPGLGSLTLALADTGAEVVAVEADTRLLPILNEVLTEGVAQPGAGDASAPVGSVRVVSGDALEVDWGEVLDDRLTTSRRPWALVANLPYNVAATIVLQLLDDVPAIDTMLVMVQREVGERLAAAPGSSAYGIPSVKVAYWAQAELVARVPPTVFIPRPRVESALVAVRRLPEPATAANFTQLFSLVRTAFGQRRKMLRRSLATIVPGEVFDAAGIDPSLRPEQLDVVSWGALAMALDAHHGGRGPSAPAR